MVDITCMTVFPKEKKMTVVSCWIPKIMVTEIYLSSTGYSVVAQHITQHHTRTVGHEAQQRLKYLE